MRATTPSILTWASSSSFYILFLYVAFGNLIARVCCRIFVLGATEKFKLSHNYAKLAPQHKTNQALVDEGEGALGSSGEKKNSIDFALWKASKQGEPKWNSPWGAGRPGWHIECSVMASDILGSRLDIHGGGVDLKFPHHDNELAQAEAHDGSHQWVNYFLHAGHLNIEGLKMSKSLKNFIPIRQILMSYTPRQIRLFFLSVPWDGPMNFSDQLLESCKTREKTLREFFANVSAQITKLSLRSSRDKDRPSEAWLQSDRDLRTVFDAAVTSIDADLRNNLNYPRATHTLMGSPLSLSLSLSLCALLSCAVLGLSLFGRRSVDLESIVGETNKYLRSNPDTVKPLLLNAVLQYVRKMLRVFGVIGDDEQDFISSSSGDHSRLHGVLSALTSFRDRVRTAAVQIGGPFKASLLAECDRIRDEDLVPLGIRIEDSKDKSSYKFDDPAVLIRERDQKRREAKVNEISKLVNKFVKLREDLARDQRGLKSPHARFEEEKKYSKFTNDGKPTHDLAGAELSKSAKKDVEKLHQKFSAEYQKAQAALQSNPNAFAERQQEIDQLNAQLDSELARTAASDDELLKSNLTEWRTKLSK